MQLYSTKEQLELTDGTTIDLTLNFAKLYKLKSSNQVQYERYNKIMMSGAKDVFDQIDIVYTAYLCALEEGQKPITYMKLLEVIPGQEQINVAVNSLIRPKKKTDSKELS